MEYEDMSLKKAVTGRRTVFCNAEKIPEEMIAIWRTSFGDRVTKKITAWLFEPTLDISVVVNESKEVSLEDIRRMFLENEIITNEGIIPFTFRLPHRRSDEEIEDLPEVEILPSIEYRILTGQGINPKSTGVAERLWERVRELERIDGVTIGHRISLVEQEEIPVEQEEIPVEQEEIPVEQEEIPVEQEEIPVEQEEIPVEQEEIPVEQEEIPVEQEEMLEESEETFEKSEEILEKSEEILEKSEEILVKSEETFEKSEETLVKSEETLVKSEETLVKSEETLVKSEGKETACGKEVLVQVEFIKYDELRELWRKWYRPNIHFTKPFNRGQVVTASSGYILGSMLLRPQKGEKILISSPSPEIALVFSMLNPGIKVVDIKPQERSFRYVLKEKQRLSLNNLEVLQLSLAKLMQNPKIVGQVQGMILDLTADSLGRRPQIEFQVRKGIRNERWHNTILNYIGVLINRKSQRDGRVVLLDNTPDPRSLLNWEKEYLESPNWKVIKWPKRMRKFRIGRLIRFPKEELYYSWGEDVSECQFALVGHEKLDTIMSTGIIQYDKQGRSSSNLQYRRTGNTDEETSNAE